MPQRELQVIRFENDVHLLLANGGKKEFRKKFSIFSLRLVKSVLLDPEPGVLNSFIHLNQPASTLYVLGTRQGSRDPVMMPLPLTLTAWPVRM